MQQLRVVIDSSLLESGAGGQLPLGAAILGARQRAQRVVARARVRPKARAPLTALVAYGAAEKFNSHNRDRKEAEHVHWRITDTGGPTLRAARARAPHPVGSSVSADRPVGEGLACSGPGELPLPPCTLAGMAPYKAVKWERRCLVDADASQRQQGGLGSQQGSQVAPGLLEVWEEEQHVMLCFQARGNGWGHEGRNTAASHSFQSQPAHGQLRPPGGSGSSRLLSLPRGAAPGVCGGGRARPPELCV